MNNSIWLSFQQLMWQARSNWLVVAGVYVGLIVAWLAVVAFFAKRISAQTDWRKLFAYFFVPLSLLEAGYNALSADIFNYIFNEKILVVYHANPQVKVALDYGFDTWTRFMQNTHTPAPYGFGWLGIAVLPFVFGFGKFFSTYFAMKEFVVYGMLFAAFFVWQLLGIRKVENKAKRFWWFFTIPLFLWETGANGHNDVWMMWPTLAAFWLVLLPKRKTWHLVLACLLFAFGASVKFASLVALPVFLVLLLWPLLQKYLPKQPLSFVKVVKNHWPEVSAVLLLLPLLTSRSQQFHPWYLIWAWCFFPLIEWKPLRNFLLVLSVTSLLRYVPWMLAGLQYTDIIELQMRLITWSALPITLVLQLLAGKLDSLLYEGKK